LVIERIDYAMDSWQEAALIWLNESPNYGILITDSDLNIRSWNRWLEEHSGYLSSDVVGRNLLEVLPELVERGLDSYYRQAAMGEGRVLSQRLHRYLLRMPATSGYNGFTVMPQSAEISPLVQDKRVLGTVTIIQDLTVCWLLSSSAPLSYANINQNRYHTGKSTRYRETISVCYHPFSVSATILVIGSNNGSNQPPPLSSLHRWQI